MTNLTILVTSVMERDVADDSWSLAEAKAKFSEVVERARSEGPQRVTRNGKPAVVVSEADWEEACGQRKSFIEALLDPAARVLTDEEADTLVARDRRPGRPVEF
jgi:prevent-host-death family protein